MQIIKDDNDPENVGKIMVWPYGVKIFNKLQAEMKPEFGKPHIPFDLFEGKPFLVHVTLVAGYNNYDNSRFLDEKMPVIVNGEKMEKTQECLTKIKEYLETSPDLGAYDYQEWDTDTENFVNDMIRNTVPGGRMIESIESSNRKTPSASKIMSDEFVLPDPPKKAAPAPKSAPKVEASPLDELDDFDSSTFDDELYSSL